MNVALSDGGVGGGWKKKKKCAYIIYEWSPRQVSAKEKAAFLAKKMQKLVKVRKVLKRESYQHYRTTSHNMAKPFFLFHLNF